MVLVAVINFRHGWLPESTIALMVCKVSVIVLVAIRSAGGQQRQRREFLRCSYGGPSSAGGLLYNVPDSNVIDGLRILLEGIWQYASPPCGAANPLLGSPVGRKI